MSEKDDTADWYYVGDFGQLGPWSMSQMIGLAGQGVITANTLVWKRGWTDWRKASSVSELGVWVGPPPVPESAFHKIDDLLEQDVRDPFKDPLPAMPARSPQPVVILHQDWGEVQSPKSRILGGVLSILFPGLGRLYLGFIAEGVIQLLVAIFTCGVGALWSWIDGLIMILGGVKYDAEGRRLRF